MKEMLRTLLVLMWMHVMVRMRRFIHTPIEILSPTILFIIIISLKPYIMPESQYKSQTREIIIEQTGINKIDFSRIAYSKILYKPDSPAATQLMHEVDMKRGNNYRGGASRTFSNLPETSETNYNIYVLFENMKGFDLPDHLEYTIRMTDKDFTTHSYKSGDDRIESHYNYGVGDGAYSVFTTLQWLIDSSYIGLKSNKTVQETVDFQEFPQLSGFNYAAQVIKSFTYICIYSLLLPFVFLMSRLLEERASGIQELMKLNGLSNGLLALSHALNALPGGLAYCVAGACLVTYAPHSCAGVVFVTLLLHYATVVALAFVCRYIVDSTAYTTTLSVVVYVSAAVPAVVLAANDTRLPPLGALAGLLPHVPVGWLWTEMTQLEYYYEGLTLAEAARSHTSRSFSVLLGLMCLVIQTAVLVLLAWYLSLVRPGRHGQALPYNFLFKWQYWKVRPDEAGGEEEGDEAPIARDPRYFEDAPRDAEVGIKIVNVSKQFPKQRALSNLSLDVYKGEITVLLGHNGAGKTTLMSIITGMLRATSGKVYVCGLDTGRQLRAARRHLGLCTQHNLSFADLTVLEHVMFFTLIKGGTFAAARSSSLELVTKLGLGDKRASKAAQLSGGMRRRLQLACALAGEARVLVLDEPTSGLDVETRRQLWDLLLSLRGSRTILLSTHFMEEADALGDRVAALHAGRLRCHATTMHLKRALGTGYRLTLTLSSPGVGSETALVSAVQRHVPAAAPLDRDAGGSLTLALPAAASGAFPALFAALEAGREALGVRAIGVGRSTLEEVFLKLCSDVDTAYSGDAADGAASEPDPTLMTVTGCTLYFRQIWVLLLRQMKYIWSKKISFFLLQLLLPLVFIGFLSRINQKTDYSSTEYHQDADIALSLDLYDELSNHKVLYNVGEEYPISNLKEMYPKFQFVETPDVARAITDIAVDVFEYEKYLVGIEINSTYAKVMYTTVYRHAAPVALNLLSNLVGGRALPTARAHRPLLTAHNHPLPVNTSTTHHYRNPSVEGSLIYVIFLVFFVMSVLMNAVTLPCRERASGARRLHVMAGCPPALLWAAALSAHWALYAALLAAPAVALAAALADRDALLYGALGPLFVVLLFGSAAFLPFVYFVSMFVRERAAAALLITCVFVFGVCTPAVWFSRTAGVAVREGPLTLVNVLLPPHAFGAAALGLVLTAANRTANVNASDQSYFRVEDLQTGAQLIIMTFQLVFYMALTILSEMGLFNYLYERLANWRYAPGAGSALHDETPVHAEREYVAHAMERGAAPDAPDALLAHDLHKNYVKIVGKSCNAVKGISFSIKKGECFGILGVNGAGKSTTFKMLTAEETATRGRARSDTHDLRPLLTQKYLNTMSYCPQFFGLDKFLTGRENLELVLTLRGLAATDVAAEADAWIDVVGLQKYASRPVSSYSGGCLRRLACAAALCLRAGAALLDEPSAGVDVAARRRMWAAVRRAQRRGGALLVCSHSMDEMEALCARIAIVSGGRVAALGSAGALRAAHAAGHAVQVKLRQLEPATRQQGGASAAGDEMDGAKMMVNRFKSEVMQNFDCTLKDEHKTMLHYHINRTMSYSELFERMERLRDAFPGLVDDYSVTETTLEEVFLSFAKDRAPPHDGGPTAV